MKIQGVISLLMSLAMIIIVLIEVMRQYFPSFGQPQTVNSGSFLNIIIHSVAALINVYGSLLWFLWLQNDSAANRKNTIQACVLFASGGVISAAWSLIFALISLISKEEGDTGKHAEYWSEFVVYLMIVGMGFGFSLISTKYVDVCESVFR